MISVHERLYVGTDEECITYREGWAIIHACKSPCHQRAVGYRKSLPNTHPYYLVYKQGSNLYLNIIDPPGPLFKMPTFNEFLKFAKENWDSGKTLFIHCNKGESRAPSLALLFLAKCLGKISNDSYDKAKSEFMRLYPGYIPGVGLQTYLGLHWHEIKI
jgi:protein-tyrosine phosphatase